MEWKNLGERPVYENPWFRVNLADVELPGGRHLDHFVIRQRAVALTAAVNDQEQILLIWRHRFITETWGWELPAGVIDDGETAKEAASREMLEETGWRAGRLHHLVTLEPSNGLADALHHVYRAEGAEYINHPKDDFESTRREWVSLKAMPDLVRDGEIKDGSAAAALLLLHHMRCCSDR